jgi:hypothetical protein
MLTFSNQLESMNLPISAIQHMLICQLAARHFAATNPAQNVPNVSKPVLPESEAPKTPVSARQHFLHLCSALNLCKIPTTDQVSMGARFVQSLLNETPSFFIDNGYLSIATDRYHISYYPRYNLLLTYLSHIRSLNTSTQKNSS